MSRPESVSTDMTQEQEIVVRRSLTILIGAMRNHGLGYHDALRQFEAAYVGNLIAKNHGHLGKVAVQLGIHRNTLTRTLRKLNLKRKDVLSSEPNREFSRADR